MDVKFLFGFVGDGTSGEFDFEKAHPFCRYKAPSEEVPANSGLGVNDGMKVGGCLYVGEGSAVVQPVAK